MASLVSVIGCGGFSASGTASPLMFLLPGASYDKSADTPITTNKSVIATSNEKIEEFKSNWLTLNSR